MTTNTERWPAKASLMVAHCAGMVDLVALPVWVGTLIAGYGFDAQRAGALATLFLAAVVASSLFFAPRFNRIAPRRAATAGFATAALAFAMAASTREWSLLALLHVIGGAGVGCALSFTHGTIGRSSHPHRLFAVVSFALGVFAIVFLGATPKVIEATGAPALFWAFATVMTIATLVSAAAFPKPEGQSDAVQNTGRIDAAVWCGALGLAALALMQQTIFSFVVRIGIERGFTPAAVNGALIVMAFVALIPAPLAALLERRLPVRAVILIAPVLHAVFTYFVVQASSYPAFVAALCLLPAVLIFTHTFAFGLLARLDPSGRALAATPAMVMAGSAIGPFLGGTLVNAYGYTSLALAVAAIGVVSVLLFSRARRSEPTPFKEKLA